MVYLNLVMVKALRLSQVRAIYHTSIILAVTYYTRNVSYARGNGTGHPADYEVHWTNGIQTVTICYFVYLVDMCFLLNFRLRDFWLFSDLSGFNLARCCLVWTISRFGIMYLFGAFICWHFWLLAFRRFWKALILSTVCVSLTVYFPFQFAEI